MTQIDWSLARGNGFANALATGQNIAQQVMEGYERGRRMRQGREVQDALEVLSRNPGDEAARAVVFRANPHLGMKLNEYAQGQEFRSAMADYVAPGGQPNALLGMGAQGTPVRQSDAPPMNALAATVALPPVRPGASFSDAFAPLVAPPVEPEQRPQAPEPAGSDFAFLGRPASRADAAFLRMVRVDPVQALKVQSAMRDSFVDRLQAESEFYGLAVDALSRVQDDAGWQASMQRLAPMAQAIGGDLSSIPAAYPGAEAVQQLLERALPVKERLDYLMREANMEADNARQDRNVESMIGDRNARRAEQRRYNDARIETTRRGQDMTDARVRAGRGSGGSRSGGRSGGRSVRPTATDERGNKVEWNGTAWVPVQ